MRHDFERKLNHAICNLGPAELAARFPEVTKGRYKLRDGGGLYLQIEPSNARGWRFDYQRPDSKKPNTISFGAFPEVSLSEARDKCDAARKLVAAGLDPSANQKEVRRAAVLESAAAVTFLAFTNFEQKNTAGEIPLGAWWQFEMIEKKSRASGEQKSPATFRRTKFELRLLQGALGHRPMKDIKPAEILAVLDSLTKRGCIAEAHRVHRLASKIFDLAIARQVCDYNVAAPCKAAIAEHVTKKYPALTDHIEALGLEETERQVGELMRRIAKADTRLVVRRALEMLALTFPRPHNICEMRWDDIKGNLWTIPAHEMKTRRPHKVWLSRQAVAILDEMRPLTGTGARVFPTTRNTLLFTLADLGYSTTTEQSLHGFRSIASTLLNESGQWSEDAIERQMAHKIGGKRDGEAVKSTRGIYNKAERQDERETMMQFWADYLERLRDGNVVQIKAA